MPTPTRARRGGNSIALGIISLLTIALISMLCLMARPVYFKYAREILHPFDPHPDGVTRVTREEVTNGKESFNTAVNATASSSKLQPPPPQPIASLSLTPVESKRRGDSAGWHRSRSGGGGRGGSPHWTSNTYPPSE
ncbi:MAG: hypothetical protein WDW38_005563 [Sanguina aurantia]